MELLHEDECLNYSGGGRLSLAIGVTIAAFGSFILGIIDGISNPKKCNAR